MRNAGHNPTTFRQIGWTSMVLGAGVGVVACAIVAYVARLAPRAAPPPPVVLLGPAVGIAAVVLAVVMCSSLTIEVGDDALTWYFTGKILSKTLRYADIVSYRAIRFFPMSFGYRIGPGRTAWIVHGGKAVVFETAGRVYIVGTGEPGRVCTEIARRAGRAPAVPAG